jgi:NO-binding membrane sensor protein with MHYT domain
MVVTHEPWLVLLSVLVAIQGAYVGLSLTLELPGSTGTRRKLLLAGAAGTLAVAVWSMHFVGMLAVRSPIRIDFLALPTLVSFLVCVVVVGLAVFLLSSAPNSRLVRAISALVMGAGIVTMHFIGMSALQANAVVHHHAAYVVASFVIGVAASGLAIHFALAGTIRPPLVAASIALGLAISGMHYTAMAGMTLQPLAGSLTTEGPALSRDLLAIIVAITAFGSSSAFLLAVLPDEPPSRLASGIWQGSGLTVQPGARHGSRNHRAPKQGRLASHPLDRAGVAVGPPSSGGEPAMRGAAMLPVQKEGAIYYLPVGRLHAVKAEAHYTTVFDGTKKFFCALSISDVERRLDQTRFIRVHRSHIVAVDHIASLKKSGERGVAELDSPTPYSLPVSRRKLPTLKAILDARA